MTSILDEETYNAKYDLRRHITLIKDINDNYWSVSTAKGTKDPMKIDETMVFSCDLNGKIKKFGSPKKTYLPANHTKACNKFLKFVE